MYENRQELTACALLLATVLPQVTYCVYSLDYVCVYSSMPLMFNSGSLELLPLLIPLSTMTMMTAITTPNDVPLYYYSCKHSTLAGIKC